MKTRIILLIMSFLIFVLSCKKDESSPNQPNSNLTVPSLPAASSPQNNATNIAIPPILSWSASTGATSYTLQVATDNTFTNLIINQSGITGTSQQVNGLNGNTTYYWRVNAANSLGTSSWSTVWIFTTASSSTIPPLPIASSPQNNATNVAIPPVLSWGASSGATSYTLQVSTDNAFANLILNQSGITSTNVTVNGLSSNTTYYWRVSATNSLGTSSWSAIWIFTTASSSTIPPLPIASSPQNNATNVAIPPVLSWSASSGATSYTLQVSTNNTFANLILNQSGITTTNVTVNGLSNNTTYYWRVSATNNLGTSSWSAIWIFTTASSSTIPPLPIASSPQNNATNVAIPPVLSWSASSGATSYTLQVSTNNTFANLILNQSGITTTNVTVNGLSNNTTYYWRVSATNSLGTSGWSAVWIFSTSSSGTAPQAPTLLSPTNNATNISSSPTITWNASSGAVSYSLQVSINNSFSSLVYNQSSLTNTSQTVTGLTSNTTYYWRVSATNSFGTSGWSTGWSFTTSSSGTPPQAPTLSSPANNTTNISTSPIITWNASSGATSYTLQVSSNNTFGTFAFNQSGLTYTSQQLPILYGNTVYYWRINATNSNGTSGWSEVWTFTTGAGALIPSSPNLLSPANNSLNIVTPPTLTWNSSSGAISYTLQVSINNSFSSFVYNQSSLTSTSQQITTLSSNTIYYWRVSATNSFGTSGYSVVWNFTTSTGGTVPPVPTISSPANNATGLSTSPTLSWSASSGATSYTLQVSTNNSFTSFVFNQSGITGTSQQVTGLSNNTTYYWRVSATNSSGTSSFSSVFNFTTVAGSSSGTPCPGTPTFTYQGKTYNTVQIGTQCWMKENLDVGTMILGTQSPNNNATIEKYCYNDDANKCTTYGGLYEWKEAMAYSTTPGVKGICPDGWHIPTNTEFQTLGKTVNNSSNTLKAIGQDSQSTNTSGFSGLLAGVLDYYRTSSLLGSYTYFWSSTEISSNDAYSLRLIGMNDDLIAFWGTNKTQAFSIRCLKN